MKMLRNLLLFLPILGGCTSGKERIIEYDWGEYHVRINKQHKPAYFGGWLDAWDRHHEVSYGTWKRLDREWVTQELGLSIDPDNHNGRLMYLSKTKSLIQYYRGDSLRNLVIASTDTSKKDLNFTPVFGVSTFENGPPKAINWMLGKR